MIYQLVLVIGTIAFLAILWTILTHTDSMMITVLKNATPSSMAGHTVNRTAIYAEYDLVGNIMYFSLFFVSIIMFVYVVKKAVEVQALRGGG